MADHPNGDSPYGPALQQALFRYYHTLPRPVATLEIARRPVPAACAGRRTRAVAILAALRSVPSPHVYAVRDIEVVDDVLTARVEVPRGPSLAERLARSDLPSPTVAVRILLQVLSWRLAIGSANALAELLGESIFNPQAVPSRAIHLESRSGFSDFVRIDPLGIEPIEACDCPQCMDLIMPLPAAAAYASPEEMMGQPATERSRVFASAALLHELLTGRAPDWNDEERFRSIVRRAQQPIAPPSATMGTRLPIALEAWMMRGLAHPPEERPADLVAWTQGLQRAARQEGLAVDLALDLPS